jgi:hypothetical protein
MIDGWPVPLTQKQREQAAQVAVLVVCFTAVGAWLFWPPDKVAVGPECQPAGFVASISERLFPKAFWRKQTIAVAAQRQNLEEEPQRVAEAMARLDESLAKARALLENMYEQHPELRPSPEVQMAEAMRDRAEKMLQAADNLELGAAAEKYRATAEKLRLSRIASLRRCEGILRGSI